MFGRESKEDKQAKEIQKFMEQYQLEDLDEKDLIVLQRVASKLLAMGLFNFGMVFSFPKAEERLKVGYLGAMVDQNWMMIRQLSRLNKNIEKLVAKNI